MGILPAALNLVGVEIAAPSNNMLRKLMIGAGALIGLLVLIAVGISLFFDVNRYKPQIEQAVNKSTGLTLQIKGRAQLKLLPRIKIALNDVHLLNPSSPKTEIFSAKQIQVAPRVTPLLFHHKVILDKVFLEGPQVQVEKSSTARMNFQTQKMVASQPSIGRNKSAAGQEGTGLSEIHSVNLENGKLSYVDHSSGEKIKIDGLNVDLSGVTWNQNGLPKSLSFHGQLSAKAVKSGVFSATSIEANIQDNRGLIRIDPYRLKMFGGDVHGNAQVDLRGSVPKFAVTQMVSHVDLNQAFPNLNGRVSGTVDGEVHFLASGKDANAITKTLNGDVSMRSQDIHTSYDIDSLASKMKVGGASDLASLGASLFSSLSGKIAGQAAGTVAQTSFSIQRLISNWKVTNGVAQTKTVAISTLKNTVAFRGDANLVTKQYQNFFVATVDQNGCAKTRVKIQGPLNKPQPAVISTAEAAAKSALSSEAAKLGGKEGSIIAGMFGGGEKSGENGPGNVPEKAAPSGSCDQFYRI